MYTSITVLNTIHLIRLQRADVFLISLLKSQSSRRVSDQSAQVSNMYEYVCVLKYDCALVQLNFRLFIIYSRIYYALVIIYFNKISSSSASVTMSNQNDFVTMSMLEKLLDRQDKAYRSATMVIIEDIRSEMKDIRREMNELRESVNFMSSKYDNMKKSVEATEMKIKAVYVQMEGRITT